MNSVPIRIGPIQIGQIGTHIPSDGSHIDDGAPDPKQFIVNQGTPTDAGALSTFFSGPPLCACEIYTTAPAFSDRKNLTVEFDAYLDPPAASGLYLSETDTKISLGGWTANGSLQVNWQKGGMVQASDASQAWFDTGFMVGNFLPCKRYSYSILYALDWTLHKFSYIRMMLNDQTFTFGVAQQNIPMSQTGWSDGALFQGQWKLNNNGMKATIELKNLYNLWS